ncbi:ABC transporter permease [Candidatus Aerophobetes bacterium]|nr:ABC transporter permease [Candidatus Aerophobetes bacterium]
MQGKIEVIGKKMFYSLNLKTLEETKARQTVAWLLLLATVVAGIITSPTFSRSHNIINVLRQAVALGLVGMGQTFVILAGGIDLSVGSTISLTSCLSAGIMAGRGEMVIPAILITFAVGICIGAANGFAVSYLKVPPLITTLGMMTIIQGMTLLYTRGPVGRITRGYAYFSEGYIGPVPFPVIFFAILFALGIFVLSRTTFGRHLYATGESEDIAHQSGIKTRLVIFMTYIICSLSATLSGLFLASRCGSGDPLMGVGYDFDSITVVLIGGTTLAGGRGGLSGTLAAIFIMSILNNILNLLGVFAFWQWIVKGLILIIALSTYRIKY